MSARRIPLLALVLCLAFTALAEAGRLETRQFTAQTSYPGSQDRRYRVFIPTGYDERTPVPMVMVLHGCNQTEANMISETRFRDLAERDTFLVVYPFITKYDGVRQQNCWGFFLDQHIHQGAGEVEDLHRIALEVEAAFRVDPTRRYVAGLSSGAGMAVALAVAYSEYFAAAGSVAGLPYAETASSVPLFCGGSGSFRPVADVAAAMRAEQRTPPEQRVVPIMAIHSRNDCRVPVLGSQNIRDSWLRRHGASDTPTDTADCTREGVACTHRRYGSPERSVVETVFYDGRRADFAGQGSHYWVGDNSGQYANPQGPSASDLLWAFFQRHPFAAHPPPTVTIASAAPSGTAITLTGTATAAAGAIAEVAARLDGRHPQPRRVATGTTQWSVTFDSLPDNATYIPVVTARDNDGLTGTVTGAPVALGTPPPNAAPMVAIDSVAVEGGCVTVAGTASDPEGMLARVEVELGTRGARPATLRQGGAYQYQECDLPGGSYATRAQAADAQGERSGVVAGPAATVNPIRIETATWQGHMSAGRIRVYAAPCRNLGFGACDLGFAEIFLEHQFNPFPLHSRASSAEWYVDPRNVH